jgi:large subunit ribosomal protein L25
MDFMRVTADSAIRVNVPLHFINEEACAGVKTGGTINHSATEVEVSCLPRYLPEYIEIDLIDVELGQTVHLSDLKLPEGVELTAFMHGGDQEEHDQAVLSVNILRAAPAEDEEGDIEAEPGVEDQDQDQEPD